MQSVPAGSAAGPRASARSLFWRVGAFLFALGTALDPYDVFRNAVLEKRAVLAVWRGSQRRFWPYGIDSRNGELEPSVYVYEYPELGGTGSWRCIALSELSEPVFAEGAPEAPDFDVDGSLFRSLGFDRWA